MNNDYINFPIVHACINGNYEEFEKCLQEDETLAKQKFGTLHSLPIYFCLQLGSDDKFLARLFPYVTTNEEYFLCAFWIAASTKEARKADMFSQLLKQMEEQKAPEEIIAILNKLKLLNATTSMLKKNIMSLFLSILTAYEAEQAMLPEHKSILFQKLNSYLDTVIISENKGIFNIEELFEIIQKSPLSIKKNPKITFLQAYYYYYRGYVLSQNAEHGEAIKATLIAISLLRNIATEKDASAINALVEFEYVLAGLYASDGAHAEKIFTSYQNAIAFYHPEIGSIPAARYAASAFEKCSSIIRSKQQAPGADLTEVFNYLDKAIKLLSDRINPDQPAANCYIQFDLAGLYQEKAYLYKSLHDSQKASEHFLLAINSLSPEIIESSQELQTVDTYTLVSRLYIDYANELFLQRKFDDEILDYLKIGITYRLKLMKKADYDTAISLFNAFYTLGSAVRTDPHINYTAPVYIQFMDKVLALEPALSVRPAQGIGSLFCAFIYLEHLGNKENMAQKYLDRAIEALEQLPTFISETIDRDMYLSLCYLKLANMIIQSEDQEKAIPFYDKFIDLLNSDNNSKKNLENLYKIDPMAIDKLADGLSILVAVFIEDEKQRKKFDNLFTIVSSRLEQARTTANKLTNVLSDLFKQQYPEQKPEKKEEQQVADPLKLKRIKKSPIPKNGQKITFFLKPLKPGADKKNPQNKQPDDQTDKQEDTRKKGMQFK